MTLGVFSLISGVEPFFIVATASFVSSFCSKARPIICKSSFVFSGSCPATIFDGRTVITSPVTNSKKIFYFLTILQFNKSIIKFFTY